MVFYNGAEDRPEREELKLSDAYTVQNREISLELKAIVLNINPGCNEPLLNACKTLKDYSEYTARVRRYAEDMSIENAIEKAINECIQEGILVEFLSRNRAEAKAMSIYEYDEEKHMRQTREEGFEDGCVLGREQGREQINNLNQKLASMGRADDIIKAAEDLEYQKKLLEEFGI